MKVFVCLLYVILLEISCVFGDRFDVLVQAHACPNMCGSGGICVAMDGNSPSAVCRCFPGFYGLDCSLRLCPSGNAWADFPSANNVAHGAFTECSNMGLCDRNLGQCKCRSGFGGPACELLLCPTATSIRGRQEQCSGHGTCITLREAAVRQDFIHFFGSTPYSGWDQDMLQSCACENGWEGPACDLQSCPKGDDPDTAGVYEMQLLECKCTTCQGGIYLTFQGDTTLAIPYDASDDIIAYQLNKLSTIEKISVRIAFGANMCSSAGSLTAITFLLPQGGITPLTVTPYGGLAGTNINILTSGAYSIIDPTLESVKGTKEYAECSNRGKCDYTAGICQCLPGFQSSNGNGAFGDRGDCGHRYMSNIPFTTRKNAIYDSSIDGVPVVYSVDSSNPGTPGVTNCPFVDNVGICSSHGTCDSNTNKCRCFIGWTGAVCNQRSCALTAKWVGEVGASHSNKAACGGIGYCNEATGQCERCGGDYGVFVGVNCEVLSCPNSLFNGAQCGNTGYCRSLNQLAAFSFSENKQLSTFAYTTPWDANSIYGCACMRAPSIDNIFHSDYLAQYATDYPLRAKNNSDIFKRGVYARAATDFWGFDCGLARCPTGDNPATRRDANEIQTIRCIATGGTFKITFRANTTLAINYNDRATVVGYKLEQLFTIHRINLGYYQSDLLTPAASDSFCSTDGSTYVVVEFLSEFGNLPLLEYTNINLVRNGGSVTFTISEQVQGTKEDVECSGQGVCNEYTGACVCRTGFGSSNDDVNSYGDRGDCTFRNRFDV